jgi:hypothetical protein
LKGPESLLTYDLELCPFNRKPDNEVKTEDELATVFLKDAPNYHRNVGRCPRGDCSSKKVLGKWHFFSK